MSDLPDYEKTVSCCKLFIRVKANQTFVCICVNG